MRGERKNQAHMKDFYGIYRRTLYEEQAAPNKEKKISSL